MSSTKWKSENGFGESSDLFGVDFKRAAVSDSEGSAIVDADFERAALSDENDAKSSQSAARGRGKNFLHDLTADVVDSGDGWLDVDTRHLEMLAAQSQAKQPKKIVPRHLWKQTPSRWRCAHCPHSRRRQHRRARLVATPRT